MRHQFGKVFRVPRNWFLPGPCYEGFNEAQERPGVVVGDEPICTGVVLIRSDRALGEYRRNIQFFSATEEPNFNEIARGPPAQFTKPLKLSLILRPPAGRIGRLDWSFEFKKSTWWSAWPDQRNIRAPDTGVPILG